ncbi:MAG: imidazole glycerol phosphate synthase subunit HisH [Nitrososphaerota archaeon]
MRIVILDYGVGNLYSIKHSLIRVGANPEITSEIRTPLDALILPGVGNFAAASKPLKGLKHTLKELKESGLPILGICLGMQLFFEFSEEGNAEGLGFLEGKIVRFPKNIKTPQIGWNIVKIKSYHEIVDGLREEFWAYFIHSYYPQPKNESVIVAETEYCVRFPSIVAKENVVGTQFHPEKSSVDGFIILKNFLKMCRA